MAIVLKVSQVGLEVWEAHAGTLKVSQSGLEVWITSTSAPPTSSRRLVNVYVLR